MQDSRGVARNEGKMSKDVLTELYNRQAKIIYSYLLKYGCRKEEAEYFVGRVQSSRRFRAVVTEFECTRLGRVYSRYN